MTEGGTHVRRSPFLVAHWVDGEAWIENYAFRTTYRGGAPALALIDRAARWISVEELAGACPEIDVARLVDELLGARILQRVGDGPRPEEEAFATWRGWNPAAGFFHATTKDVAYEPHDSSPALRLTLGDEPSSIKHAPAAEVVELPPPDRSSSLARTLLERRTWRRFGPRRLSLDELSTLLGLTWAVQAWVLPEGAGPRPLKTSPSGGARHPLEAYVVVRGVDGAANGTYHYDGERHRLARLRPAPETEEMDAVLPVQPWFHAAPVIVFVTAIFERTQWRYPFARAYRVVHLEAGHFAQTFCLAATALGLAPFCTAALGDTAIEQHLGIDGITESVLYAVGAGTRPQGAAWAPNPASDRAPALRDPAWKK